MQHCSKVSKLSLRIGFEGFWSTFDPEASLFTRVLRERLGLDVDVVRSKDQPVDLLIESVFQLNSLTKKFSSYAKSRFSPRFAAEYEMLNAYGHNPRVSRVAGRRIWFTGENKRPPSGLADGSLSFDVSDEVTKNLYFPFWMYRVNWGLEHQEQVDALLPERLASIRPAVVRERRACAFSRTREPSRSRIYRAVAQELPLDLYGAGNGRPNVDKQSVSLSYAFQVCPENDLYPGYVTEKPLEAWGSGNIPIWQGLDSHASLNPRAVLDVTGLTVSEISAKLASLGTDEQVAMQRQPILREVPSLTAFEEFLGDFVNH